MTVLSLKKPYTFEMNCGMALDGSDFNPFKITQAKKIF